MKNFRKNSHHIVLFVLSFVLVSLPVRGHAAGLATRHDAGNYRIRVTYAVGSVLSSNATLTVQSPQRLSKPIVLPDGTIWFSSGDVDGAALLPGDMGGFKIQASTNLMDWITLTNRATLTNGVLRCFDPDSVNIKQRFYRVVEQ